MRSTETPSFNTETKSHSPEDIPSLHEQERFHGRGSLRHRLIADIEGKGGYMHIPLGTVTVETHSANLSTESFFDMSDKVAKLRTEHGALEEGAELYSRGGTTLKGIDEKVHERQENGEQPGNLTFLYESQRWQPRENELHIPSAVLVHSEGMSSEEIVQLRETLPQGVPLLDAKTNRLLDETGRAERARGDHLRRIRNIMSDIALSQSINFQPRFYATSSGHDTYDTGSTQTYESRGFYESSADSSAFAMSGMDFEAQTQTRPRSRRGGMKTEQPTARMPESPEVRTHREEQEQAAWMDAQKEYDHGVALQMEDRRSTKKAKEAILQTASDLYGVDDISKLDEKQVRRVGRVVQKDMHPDLGAAGKADRNASSKANHMISLLEKEARDAAALDEKTEVTAPAPESTPQPATETEPPASEAETPTAIGAASEDSKTA